MLYLSSEIDLSYVLYSWPNLTILNLGIFQNTGTNYKASATHKLKSSPIGPNLLKSKQPLNPIFNTSQEHVPNPRNDDSLISHPPSNQTSSTNLTFNTFEFSANNLNDFHPGDLEAFFPPTSTSQPHQLQPSITQLVYNPRPPPPHGLPPCLTSLFMPVLLSAMPTPTYQVQLLDGLDSQYENGNEGEGGVEYSASLHIQHDQPITLSKVS